MRNNGKTYRKISFSGMGPGKAKSYKRQYGLGLHKISNDDVIDQSNFAYKENDAGQLMSVPNTQMNLVDMKAAAYVLQVEHKNKKCMYCKKWSCYDYIGSYHDRTSQYSQKFKTRFYSKKNIMQDIQDFEYAMYD